MRRLTSILAILCLVAALAAETYEEKLAKTDRGSAEGLYGLAMWCKENDLLIKAQRHLGEAIRIDPNHQLARFELGYVWLNERWVHESRLPSNIADRVKQERARTAGARGSSSGGKGPTIDQAAWDTTPPAIPAGHDEAVQWLQQSIIPDLNRMDHTSSAMEGAWRTLLMEQYYPVAFPVLAAAIKNGTLTDLYGVSQFAFELLKAKDGAKRRTAERLLPFMVELSKKATSGDELYSFAMVAGYLSDLRVVPRLIEILASGLPDAVDGARGSLSELLMIPEKELTKERAQEWFDRHSGQSPLQVYGAYLNDADSAVRLRACDRLYAYQDERIIPVLAALIRGEDRASAMAAVGLVQRISGNDWGISSSMDAKQRAEKMTRFEKWWKENRNSFTWLEFRSQFDAAAGPEVVAVQDPVPGWIRDLAAVDGKVARSAYDNLFQRGKDVVPDLVDALSNADVVLRSKAHDLLREITKQDFGYQPQKGSDAERSSGIAKWRAWCAEQGMVHHGEEDAKPKAEETPKAAPKPAPSKP